MPAIFRVETLTNPIDPTRQWGVFVNGQRVYGPANVYACLRWREQQVTAITRGEMPRTRLR